MLARIVAFWHIRMLRKMKRKTRTSRPWTVNFSWNLPLEVFDCFKVVALAPFAGGVVVRNTRAVHEIHITDMGKMKSLFLSLANKYRKGTIHESDIFLKKEKDASFSQVIVTGDYPAKFTYSKNSEIMKISLRYGHYNRLGVPQHSLAQRITVPLAEISKKTVAEIMSIP